MFVVFFFIREYFAYRKNLRMKYFFTPLLTIILVVITVLSVIYNGADRYRIMILFSLIAALAADTLLMIEEVDLLINGMIFFIMAHLFYIIAFSAGTSFKPWNTTIIAVLMVMNFFYLRLIYRKSGKMFLLVAVYALMLDMMVYFALTSLNKGITVSGILAASGAILFMISDYILSVNEFLTKIKNSTVYTWSLYAPAQLLIVLSTFNIK